MAVSDNTRSNDNARSLDTQRWEELYHQMQQSVEDFKEQQGRMNDQLRELITGLSRQVPQIANSLVTTGESYQGNSNHPYLDCQGLNSLDLMGRMCKNGFTDVNSFLGLITQLKIKRLR